MGSGIEEESPASTTGAVIATAFAGWCGGLFFFVAPDGGCLKKSNMLVCTGGASFSFLAFFAGGRLEEDMVRDCNRA